MSNGGWINLSLFVVQKNLFVPLHPVVVFGILRCPNHWLLLKYCKKDDASSPITILYKKVGLVLVFVCQIRQPGAKTCVYLGICGS